MFDIHLIIYHMIYSAKQMMKQQDTRMAMSSMSSMHNYPVKDGIILKNSVCCSDAINQFNINYIDIPTALKHIYILHSFPVNNNLQKM